MLDLLLWIKRCCKHYYYYLLEEVDPVAYEKPEEELVNFAEESEERKHLNSWSGSTGGTQDRKTFFVRSYHLKLHRK